MKSTKPSSEVFHKDELDMNKQIKLLNDVFISISACLLLSVACNTSLGQIKHVKPAILQRGDFSYWSWEPDIKPDFPQWPQVDPPEDLTEHFTLAGYAGDMDNIKTDENWATGCHSEPACTRIVYSPDPGQLGWAGNLWVDVMYPKYSWGVDMESVSKLTFWARGESGEEKVEFRVGSTAGLSPQPAISTSLVKLQTSWQQYSIKLTGNNHLDRVFSGFSWITTRELNPEGCTFYLDDMQLK
jgi:hypothetical protein